MLNLTKNIGNYSAENLSYVGTHTMTLSHRMSVQEKF